MEMSTEVKITKNNILVLLFRLVILVSWNDSKMHKIFKNKIKNIDEALAAPIDSIPNIFHINIV